MIKNILIILSILMSFVSTAQTDSLDNNLSKLQKAYDYLTMAHKEELRIWKLKVLPIPPIGGSLSAQKSLITYDGTPIIVSYEQKIKGTKKWHRNLSWQAEAKVLLWGADRQDILNMDTLLIGTTPNPYVRNEYQSNRLVVNATLSAELRYYYNMNRRLHRRHGRNNFSANYFAIRTTRNVLQLGTDVKRNIDQFSGGSTDQAGHPFYDNNISAYYGIQRRFLRYFFVDVQIGSAFRYGSNAYRPYNRWVFEYPKGVFGEEIEKAPRFVFIGNARIGIAF